VFDLKAAGYQDPLLVTTTDGVGTKLKIASAVACYDTIGIDLVAMCVNDLVVQGAEPLLFLDYYAVGRLELEAGRAVVAGIAEGCRAAGCTLVGGETAEMPGVYREGDFDLAGFAVGAVERGRMLTGLNVGDGDIVLGIASSGLHSNGFSLVRRIVADAGLSYEDEAPFAPGLALGRALLVPTRIYVRSMLAAVRRDLIKALAHITGGGFIENIPRVLPREFGVALDVGQWPVPPVFAWLARQGGVTPDEMVRTFNCGIGMVAVVAVAQADAVVALLRSQGEAVYRIGTVRRVRPGMPRVTIRNMEAPWPA